MSRRASMFKKEGKPRVRFPDELVFQEVVKENDVEQMNCMLRRASLSMDLNAINSAGLTALHQAALDGNFTAVRLLIKHGAQINQVDEDGWTPLHAACAEGHANIVRYLIKNGADTTIVTPEHERPIDLCDAMDFETIGVMLKATTLKSSLASDGAVSSDDDHH